MPISVLCQNGECPLIPFARPWSYLNRPEIAANKFVAWTVVEGNHEMLQIIRDQPGRRAVITVTLSHFLQPRAFEDGYNSPIGLTAEFSVDRTK
jgi:hypothetical protein